MAGSVLCRGDGEVAADSEVDRIGGDCPAINGRVAGDVDVGGVTRTQQALGITGAGAGGTALRTRRRDAHRHAHRLNSIVEIGDFGIATAEAIQDGAAKIIRRTRCRDAIKRTDAAIGRIGGGSDLRIESPCRIQQIADRPAHPNSNPPTAGRRVGCRT